VIGGAGQSTRGRVLWRDAKNVTEVGPQPAATSGAGGVADHGDPAADPVRRSRGQVAHDHEDVRQRLTAVRPATWVKMVSLPMRWGASNCLVGSAGPRRLPRQTEAAPSAGLSHRRVRAASLLWDPVEGLAEAR